MSLSTLSDDEVIAQVRDIFANCIPSIPFDSIEAGDFADGHRFIALIDFLRDGRATLGTKTRNPFQLQPILLKALQSIAGRSSLPSFRIENITTSNQTETIKLLQWILTIQKKTEIKPQIAWLIRMSIIARGSQPIINSAIISRIAEHFGLSGNPFEAFRKAGITISDDPSEALISIFRASRGKLHGEIFFVHDVESETELSRIQGVIANISERNVASMTGETKILNDTLTAVKNLKTRLDLNRATTALIDRTNRILQEAEDVLNRTLRNLEFQRRRDLEQKKKVAEEAIAAIESKISAVEEQIVKITALAVRQTPDTIDGMEKRIQNLNMELIWNNIEAIALDANCTKQRIMNLRKQFMEANNQVTKRRYELEKLIESIQFDKRQKHEESFRNIKLMLIRVETAINERTGDFQKRFSILSDQISVLNEQKQFVMENGKSMDEDLRIHKIFDFEPIEPLQAEIVQLREKIQRLIAEEKEIDRRRNRFFEVMKLANIHFESIEQRIQSFAFASLAIARKDKGFVIESEELMMRDGKLVDEAWETLIMMRAFPEEFVRDYRGRRNNLFSLCMNNLLQLDEAITRLEAQGISNFLSQLKTCQCVAQEVEKHYLKLATEAELRISQLSQIENDLERQTQNASNSFQWLRVHNLDQQIATHDIESLHMFENILARYGQERARLADYLSALTKFQSRTRFWRSDIPKQRQEADRMLISDNRERNIAIYDDLVARSAYLYQDFRGVCEITIARAEETGQNTESIKTIRNHIQSEYREVLRYMRDLINERTPESRHIPDEESEFEQDDPTAEPLQLNTDRDNIINQFVTLAVNNHKRYCGQGLKIKFNGEYGIDCGGLSREFLSIICDPLLKRVLVPAGSGDVLWFPPNEIYDSNHENDLISVGFLLRLVIQTQQSVTSLLPLPFFHALKNDPMTLTDLQMIYPEQSASIENARESYNHGENVNLYLRNGREVTADLFNIFVTENIKSSMETRIKLAVDAVKRGFHGGRKQSWAASFSSTDLYERVSGPTIINWMEMKTSCKYQGYSLDDISVRLFWKIFDNLNEKAKIGLLAFITSSDRPPALGFISCPIRLIKCKWDCVRQRPFPRAHTCFRSLDLPNVTDEKTMRELIQMCVEYNLGFGFG
jgi:hypothetical protein